MVSNYLFMEHINVQSYQVGFTELACIKAVDTYHE